MIWDIVLARNGHDSLFWGVYVHTRGVPTMKISEPNESRPETPRWMKAGKGEIPLPEMGAAFVILYKVLGLRPFQYKVLIMAHVLNSYNLTIRYLMQVVKQYPLSRCRWFNNCCLNMLKQELGPTLLVAGSTIGHLCICP